MSSLSISLTTIILILFRKCNARSLSASLKYKVLCKIKEFYYFVVKILILLLFKWSIMKKNTFDTHLKVQSSLFETKSPYVPCSAWNSESAYLCLQSARIKGLCHYTQQEFKILKVSNFTRKLIITQNYTTQVITSRFFLTNEHFVEWTLVITLHIRHE